MQSNSYLYSKWIEPCLIEVNELFTEKQRDILALKMKSLKYLKKEDKADNKLNFNAENPEVEV
jgi:hypothetical protein